MPETQPHIAMFLRNLTGGGAERVMLNLASIIATKNIKVDLVLIKAEGAYLSQVPKEVKIVDLKTSDLDKGRSFRLPTSFQSTTSLPKLVRYLRQAKPRSLLSATHYPNEISILAKYLARVPTKVIASEHTTLSLEAKRVEQISARLAPWTSRLFYPWAEKIVAVSQGVAQDLQNLTGLREDKIEVIYNPVITPELQERAREPVEHPWFAPGEPAVVLGIGRFVAQKDFSTLIRAFAKVREVRPARLMMLGNGREESKLKALVRELGMEEDVAWVGFVDNPFAYMKRGAVFVLSSAWEGLPTVLIEALAVGIPVVSTNCPSGPEEILDGGKYGELVSVGDVEAIAQGILKVLGGNVKSVPPEWLEQFTWETATEKYLEVLGVDLNR